MVRAIRKKQDAYKRAGVDVAGADAWITRMQTLIRTTPRRGVLADSGRFAGLFQLNADKRNCILVASTDGVGTKLKLALELNQHNAIGIDVVAMNTNDVLVHGAQPLFFLDYIAIGKLNAKLMTTLMRGVVEGCRQSGCALLGGETAEMPGMYANGEYDVVGFAVGAVSPRQRITGAGVRAGDTIVGLASSGVHANGFSLVRQVLSKPEQRRMKKALLAPTRIYVQPVLRALKTIPIKAIAHITGGGLERRIPSLLKARKGVSAEIRYGTWPVPKLFQRIQHAGALSDRDMRRTFNMGIGMALVCPTSAVPALIRLMTRAGVPAWPIGTLR